MEMPALSINTDPGPRVPTRTVALLLAIVILLAVVPTTAIAAGGPPDGAGGGNGPKGPGDRNVDVDMEPNRARIRSTVQGDNNELKYQIEAHNQLTVEMQYRNQADSEEASLQMMVVFRDLVEYEDLDEDGQFGPADEVVSTYDLEGAPYENLEHIDEEAQDGKKLHRITARTRDGVFAMVTYTTETQTRSGQVSPNLMKIDLVIEDFPFTRTTTRLAMRSMVGTRGPVTLLGQVGDRPYLGDNEGGIEAEDDGGTGFYTWVRSAEVDGATEQVHAQISSDGEGTELAFNYAQGESIVHDPRLGVPLEEATAFDVMERLLPYLAAIVVGAVVVVFTVHARKRKD